MGNVTEPESAAAPVEIPADELGIATLTLRALGRVEREGYHSCRECDGPCQQTVMLHEALKELVHLHYDGRF